MKRSIAPGLAAVIGVLSFTDCSGQTGAASDAGSSQTSQEVVLTFPYTWAGSDSEAKVFGEMIVGFNTEYAGRYQIKLEEQTGYGVYYDKIRTLISTGAAPGLFTVQDFPDLGLYASSGKLMNLTDFLTESDMASHFEDGIIEKAQIDDANYMMPYESAVVLIIYNQKLPEETNVTSILTTYDEFWDTCAGLKAENIFPVTQMTSTNTQTSMLWYSYALATCGDADVYRNDFDDPAFEKAAEIMVKVFQNTSSGTVGANAAVMSGHLFNERAVTYINGSRILDHIKKRGVQGLYDNLVFAPGLSYDGKNNDAYINTIQAYLVAGKQDDPQKAEVVRASLYCISDLERVVELVNSSGVLFAIKMDASRITGPLQAEVVERSTAASFMIGHFQDSVPTAVVNESPTVLESLIIGDIAPAEFVQHLKEVKDSNSWQTRFSGDIGYVAGGIVSPGPPAAFL